MKNICTQLLEKDFSKDSMKKQTKCLLSSMNRISLEDENISILIIHNAEHAFNLIVKSRYKIKDHF